jgi:hypothetical protein
MTKRNDKYQVEIGGSAQLSGSQIAVGHGARASAGKVHIGVQDAPAFAAIAASAHEEAQKAKPSKAVLSGLLDALLAGVGKVATLAGAVEAIQHAVSALL